MKSPIEKMRRPVKVGITGLRQSGKTVFLTSLLYHLLEGGEDNLPLLNKKGLSWAATELPLEFGTSRFPYRDYIEGLRGEKPSWPERTAQESKFCIRIDASTPRRKKTIRQEFLDYPGERLVDLPMTNWSYGQWCEKMIEDARERGKSELSADWIRKCSNLNASSRHNSAETTAAVTAFADYLRQCRGKDLVYIQPSRVLLEGPSAINFCPLPEEIRRRAINVSKKFGLAYDQYVKNSVKPFLKGVGRCDIQIVLVDILRILKSPLHIHCYNDTRKCLRSILDTYHYQGGGRMARLWPGNWLRPKARRVIFVATKADQATKSMRGNLRLLLEELVNHTRRELEVRWGGRGMVFDFCAAHRSTRDRYKSVGGRDLSVLEGRRKECPEAGPGVYFPGEIPSEWPKGEWAPGTCDYRFPDFLPRGFPLRDGAPDDHIHMDNVIWHILKEKLHE